MTLEGAACTQIDTTAEAQHMQIGQTGIAQQTVTPLIRAKQDSLGDADIGQGGNQPFEKALSAAILGTGKGLQNSHDCFYPISDVLSPAGKLRQTHSHRSPMTMSEIFYTELEHRALVGLSGEGRVAFLQGLVSADVTRANEATSLYGALLTPQGKFLYDFFLQGADEFLTMEVEREGRQDFRQRLARFRLRSKIALADRDDWRVYAAFGADAAAALGLSPERGATLSFDDGVVMVDPRLASAGIRAWLPSAEKFRALGFTRVEPAQWDLHRIGLGLADGRRDLVAEKTILLEAGFDELQGVDWEKGCFMGQEMTARSKYRGQIKKRLMIVAIDGPAPAPGSLIHRGDQEVGEMRSHAGQLGLAVIRLDCLESGGPLSAGDASLTPIRPDWANFS